MPKYDLVKANVSFSLDYTEGINQAMEDGIEFSNINSIKEFILDWVAVDIAARLESLIEDEFDLVVIKS